MKKIRNSKNSRPNDIKSEVNLPCGSPLFRRVQRELNSENSQKIQNSKSVQFVIPDKPTDTIK